MRAFLYTLGVMLLSAIGDSFMAYVSFAVVDPSALEDGKIWSAMGIFVGFNCLKTTAAHFKDAPRYFRLLPPQDPPKA